jgi:hypothetical protein
MILAVMAVAVGATGWLVLKPAASGASTPDGRLLVLRNNRYVAEGWQHLGAGTFTLDSTAGELRLGGGPGLLWYAAREFGDVTLELDFRRSDSTAEAGVLLRLPQAPEGDAYAARAFAIRLGPRVAAGTTPRTWHHLTARSEGERLTVSINDTTVDWTAATGGSANVVPPRGHIGLESRAGAVEFRNIVVRAKRGSAGN